MFGITSQSSGLGLRQSPVQRVGLRQPGRQVAVKSESRGVRRPRLTITDLEASEPFEQLRSIEKMSTRFNWKLDDQTASPSMARVSFITAGSDDVRHATQEPPTISFLPGNADVKRTARELMTSPVSGHTDSKPTTPKMTTSLVPGYSDVKRTTPEFVTSLVPGYTDIKRTTPEFVTSSVPGYTDVKRTTRELMTSPVPGYSDIKPSTKETMTSSACMYAGPAVVPGNGVFNLGECITVSSCCSVVTTRQR